MSLRIGVVAGSLNPQIGGGWTLAMMLVEGLKAAQSSHEFVFIDKLLQECSSDFVATDFSEPPRSTAAANVGLRLFAEQSNQGLKTLFRYLPSARAHRLQREQILLSALPKYLHCTALERLERTIEREKLDLIWYLIPNAGLVSVPFIATVLDLEHRNQPYFPEVSVTDWTWSERELNFSTLLPRATIILTGTETGKREIIGYYHVNPARVKVMPFPAPVYASLPSIADIQSTKVKHGITGDFLLYPAQFWAHKNHVNLLLALDMLRREHDLRPSLVFTGSDKGNRDYVHKIIDELQLSKQVFDLGFVSQEDLIVLYRGARALVYPSFFGPDNLPPLEAFALGCPVLAADGPGPREQLGAAALYFDPKAPAEIASKLAQVLGDADCRRTLVEEGARISRQRTPHTYLSSICSLLDEFEPIRRCWSKRPAPLLTRAGLSFARGEPGVLALNEGWGAPEAGGTWSVQGRCTLRINVGKGACQPFSIAFACRAVQGRNTTIGCYVDNTAVQRWGFTTRQAGRCRRGYADETRRLQIDPDAIAPNGDVLITFLIPDPVSPLELGQNSDFRQLGIWLERMWIEDP